MAKKWLSFAIPVDSGLAQQVAIQDEGVFWSRLYRVKRIDHFVWVSDGEFDYFFDNNKNTSIAELPEQADWRKRSARISDDRRKHLIECRKSSPAQLRYIQRKFNELHERLYPSGGFSFGNEAIDEICRLLFMKTHLETQSFVHRKRFKRQTPGRRAQFG
jgi:type I restriction enzyme M protein